MQTIVYIDRDNLFYGCLKHTNYKWLHLIILFEKILHTQNPANQLIKFTADILAKVATSRQSAQHCQQIYHNALLHSYSNRIKIIKGYDSLEIANILGYQRSPDKAVRQLPDKIPTQKKPLLKP